MLLDRVRNLRGAFDHLLFKNRVGHCNCALPSRLGRRALGLLVLVVGADERGPASPDLWKLSGAHGRGLFRPGSCEMLPVMSNDDWEARVGSNPWRGLIFEECRAVEELGLRPAGGSTSPIGYPLRDKDVDASAFRYRRAADKKSLLVFQTGRLSPTAMCPRHLALLAGEAG